MKKTLFSLFLACCFIAAQVTAKPANPITVPVKPAKAEIAKKANASNDCSGVQWNCHQADPVNTQHVPCGYVEHSANQQACCTVDFPCFMVIEISNTSPNSNLAIVGYKVTSPAGHNFSLGSMLAWPTLGTCPDGLCGGSWLVNTSYKGFNMCAGGPFEETATSCPISYNGKLQFTVAGCTGDVITVTVTLQDGTTCSNNFTVCAEC